jgi:transglutaminase-like putative cysteine protease
MYIKIGFDIQLSITSPMALIYLLHVHPSRRDDLLMPEAVMIEPHLPVDEYLDAFGNRCGRVNAFVGVNQVRFLSQAIIRDSGLPDAVHPTAIQHDPTELPPATLQFLLPSRYCEVDSELLQFAWNQFGQTPTGWARVQAICDFVHNHIKFGYDKADPTRTALQAYQKASGVCRDYTHLAIAFARGLNIPARYCSGYISDVSLPLPYAEQDFCAWMEVFLGGRWWVFDPRNNAPRIGRILMSQGRDAADTPLAHFFGAQTLREFKVWVDELPD